MATAQFLFGDFRTGTGSIDIIDNAITLTLPKESGDPWLGKKVTIKKDEIEEITESPNDDIHIDASTSGLVGGAILGIPGFLAGLLSGKQKSTSFFMLLKNGKILYAKVKSSFFTRLLCFIKK